MRRQREGATPLRILYALAAIILWRWGVGAQISLAVPAWEAYDEPGHFAYAVTLATTGRLPERPDTVRPTSAAETPERIQPPLYYALIALALSASNTDVSNFQYPDPNPYFYFGAGNPNYALHRDPPTPAQAEIERALRFSRLWSLLLTLPGVAFAYRAARTHFSSGTGDNVGRTAAIFAALVVAIWPQALFSGSMVTNDSLIFTFSTAATWLILRVAWERGAEATALRSAETQPSLLPAPRLASDLKIIQRKATVWDWFMIATVIGLGMLVKLNMLLMLVPFGVLVLARSSRRQAWRWLGLAAAGTVGLLALLATSESILLPFREVTHLGESMLGAMWNSLTTNGVNLIWAAFTYLMYSGFGLFGWGSVPFPTWMGVIGVVVIIGLLISFVDLRVTVNRRDESGAVRYPKLPYQLLYLILVAQIVGGLALVLFARTNHVLNGRYVLPALLAGVVIYTHVWAVAAGLRRIYEIAGVLCILGLIPLSLWMPGYLGAAYARPPALEGHVATQRPYEFHPGARLIGYKADPTSFVTTNEGKRWLRVQLFWTATTPIASDYLVRVELIGADGNGYGLHDTIPGNGLHPSTNWRVGEVFADDYWVPLRSDAPPGQGYVRVSMLADRTVVAHNLHEITFDVPR